MVNIIKVVQIVVNTLLHNQVERKKKNDTKLKRESILIEKNCKLNIIRKDDETKLVQKDDETKLVEKDDEFRSVQKDDESKLVQKDDESTFRKCNPYKHTKCVKSIYHVDRVPSKMFEKSNGEYYTVCSDCRNYNSLVQNKYNNKKKNNDKIKKEIIEKDCLSEFSYCPYTGHSTIVKSFHPQNLVPISLFIIEQNNPKSKLLVNCLDCREYMREYTQTFINNFKSLAEDKRLHACVSCHKLIENYERAINLDGTLGIFCIPCKEYRKQLYDKNKQQYIDIKLEFIEKYQCCCQDCKFLFLKPNDDSLIVQKIPTYEKYKDGNRYALINDKEIHVKNIIKLYSDVLEFSIIEFDHLPEKDQRERGLLLPNEIYVPKKLNVSGIQGKASAKLESLKCQHLCILCHVKKTIGREKDTKTNGITKIKYDYVSKLKEKGCSSCKFTDIDTPRFFDMDHLDIDDKIACIGKMCQDSHYSLDDVIKECNKCRVLCKHCHRIHTNKQIKKGLFSQKIKDI